MKTTTPSSTARSRQILEMTCLDFSLIKPKCENHAQMSVRQFGLWLCPLLLGFYGIFYVFQGSSLVFVAQKITPKLFFPRQIPTCALKKSPSLFEREVSLPHAPIKQGPFIEPGGAKSFSHSHKRASALPSTPFTVSVISFSLSPSLCLSLSATRRLMAI